ncbi:MAG TPA: phosphoribosylglycinamide formyltransferase [Cytophagaceae bacterium]
MSTTSNIALFCSGSGSNAAKIIEHFKGREEIKVKLILANNPNAYALTRAKDAEIPSRVFSKDEFYNSSAIIDLLKSEGIDWVILAGFLWLVPKNLIAAYPNNIINIHPALLPKYGGKGMYGHYVHEAVVKAKERESGMTIHLVDENYDEGKILFQARCPVEESDTPEIVAKKVLELEHLYFPQIIENTIKNTLPV